MDSQWLTGLLYWTAVPPYISTMSVRPWLDDCILFRLMFLKSLFSLCFTTLVFVLFVSSIIINTLISSHCVKWFVHILALNKYSFHPSIHSVGLPIRNVLLGRTKWHLDREKQSHYSQQQSAVHLLPVVCRSFNNRQLSDI